MPHRAVRALCVLLLAAMPTAAQTIYGVFGLPSPDIGMRQLGTLDPTTGGVSLLGSSTSIDVDTIGTYAGITAVAVAGDVFYLIGDDNGTVPATSTIYTVDLDTGATLNAVALGTYTASEVAGLWYDQGSSTLWGLFIDSGDRALASIDPTSGTVASPVNGAIAEGNVSTAPGVFTGDSDGQRVFFVGTPDSLGEPQVFEVSTADGTVTPHILEDYDESLVQGIEWDAERTTLWMIVHLGTGRRLASYDVEEEFLQLSSGEIDFGDPIGTNQGIIALDAATGQLFFLGNPSSAGWSVYTVDVTTGDATSQELSGDIQIGGWAGIEIVPGPELSFTKSDGDVTAVPGDTVSYTLTVANAAEAGPAEGVSIEETVPAESTFSSADSSAGWSCSPDANAGSTCTLSLPDIAPGDDVVRTFAVVVDASVSAGVTQLENTATVSATNATESVEASDTTPIISAAVLTLGKDDGGASSVPGAVIGYTLTASNIGDQDAASVVLGDTVPANTTFAAGSSTPGWSCSPDASAGSTCTLAVGTLGGGSQAVATFAVQVVASVPAGVSQISNSASVSAANASTAIATDSTPVIASPSLGLSKTEGGGGTTPGALVSYQLGYSNSGDQDTASAVLTETVPAQTTFDPVASTVGWTCLPDGSAGSTCTLAIGTLGGGASDVAVFAVQVDDPVLAGTTEISNEASFDAANAPAPAPAQDTTPVTAAPELALTKSDGDVSTFPDDTLAYALVYENQGDENAADVVVTETVPDNTTFAPAASTPGWSCAPDLLAGSTCTYEAGTVIGGKWGLVFFSVTVDNPIPVGTTEISNTASVDASNADAAAEGSDTTPIDVILDLAVTKSDGDVVARPGGPIDYAVHWENVGTQSTAGVEVTETVPVGTTFDPGSSSPGWSCLPDGSAGSTCVLAVGALAAGESGSATFSVDVDDPLSESVSSIDNTVSIADDGALGPDLEATNDRDSTSTGIDDTVPTVVSVDAVPSVGGIEPCDQLFNGVSTLTVELADTITGVVDADHMASYMVVSAGPDADLDTTSCGPVWGDDVEVPLTDVVVSGPATNPLVTLTLSSRLSNGVHLLLVCDTIVDGAGNALDGDGDGVAGGDFARRFRVDIGNLLANSNFDDCSDAPVTLAPWMEDSQAPSTVGVTTAQDLDGSGLSGSAELYRDGSQALDLSIGQCVELSGGNLYFAEAAVRPEASLIGSGADAFTATLWCSFSDQAGCAAPQPPIELDSATVEPSGAPEWTSLTSDAVTPAPTDVSAVCGVSVIGPAGVGHRLFVDDLFFGGPIFADGFESGDTSRWSATVVP